MQAIPEKFMGCNLLLLSLRHSGWKMLSIQILVQNGNFDSRFDLIQNLIGLET